MLRLIWIFRFAVGKCLDGGRLMVGGTGLLEITWLGFANVARNCKFENVDKEFYAGPILG